jgi:primosomal protein N' (replication factor Y)
MAQLVGSRRGLDAAVAQLDLPPSAQLLGPIPLDAKDSWHVLVRAPLEATPELTTSLAALKALRSARKEDEVVTVRVDPVDSW